MLSVEVLCEYPIQYLQDKLRGITTNSLTVIACASGCGKSTISRLLTRSAVNQQCPVVLYSLEDAPGTFASDEVRQEFMACTGEKIDLLDFALQDTKNPEEFKLYKKIVAERAMERSPEGIKYQRVHEMVAVNDWTIDKVAASIKQEIEHGYRLFIIDHLDVLNPQETVEGMSSCMDKLWGLVAEYGIAIITFSQLSSNRIKTSLCPSMDDMRGSRKKSFKATNVITLARHDYGYYGIVGKPYAKPTYIRIAKARGTDTGCAVIYFDNGKYLKEYQEVQCNESGTFIDGMTQDKLQRWKMDDKENRQ